MRSRTWQPSEACSVSDCSDGAHCRGLCKVHYERQRRGAPVEVPIVRSGRGKTILERVQAQYVVHPCGCWIWTSSTNREGYGRIKHNGIRPQAHRVVYELLIGPIPAGLELDHLCRNRRCVNPEHLEPVTHAENCRRGSGQAGINARKTHCVRGHPLTGDNLRGRRDRRECRTCYQMSLASRRLS